MSPALLAGVAFACTLLLGVPLGRVLRASGLVDRPNERSSHSVPTVRGGGIGFVFVSLALGEWMFRGSNERSVHALWSFASTLLALVSFADDFRGLPALTRLSVQSLAALVPAAVVYAAFGGNGSPAALGLAALTVIGVVGMTNAYNFMDGIDGIATVHAVVSATCSASLSARGASSEWTAFAWVLAGATLGFLPWNFPKARMFMGDVGSAYLGFTFATLVAVAVAERGLAVLASFALVHTGFVLDTGITFFRRARRGERLFSAHREHFYQRLIRAGRTHPRVTLTYGAATALCGLLGHLALGAGAVVKAICVAGAVALWAAIFAYAERAFAAFERSLEKAPAVYSPPPAETP